MSGNKRMRYGSLLSLKKPAIVHQNVQVVPPAGYDEEGRLPESLPPTPVVDLITEDEEELERTPQHGIESQPQIEQPTVEQLNPQEIENEEEFQPPPPLQSLRGRGAGGKNMAAVLASIRETSPVSSASRSPPVSPAMSQTSQDGDDVFLYVEAEMRRLQETKTRMERLQPKIRQRQETSRTRMAEIRRQMAILERSLEEEVIVQQQCEAALMTIGRYSNL